MNCTQCNHPETDHGPESGRWADNQVIPGRLCYYMENQGYQEDLCPCSGFNEPASGEQPLTILFVKAGIIG